METHILLQLHRIILLLGAINIMLISYGAYRLLKPMAVWVWHRRMWMWGGVKNWMYEHTDKS